jgi:hypothetical protein
VAGRLLSYLVFKSSFIIDQCPLNMDIPVPKTEALQMGPKNQIAVSQEWLLQL